MRTSLRILLFAFICLMPFQDTILQATPLQRLGSSFAVLPLMAMAFLQLSRRILTVNLQVRRSLLWVVCYAAAATIFGLLVLGFSAEGENLLLETLKLSIDTGLVLFAIFGIDYSADETVGPAVQIAFFITIFGILANDLNFLGLSTVTNSGFFHQTQLTNAFDNRWRGLTKEPSVLAPLIMGMGLLSAHYARNKWMKRLYWALALSLTALGASKGAFLAVIAILLILVAIRAKTNALQGIGLLVLLAPIGIFGFLLFLPQIASQALMASNSIATRLTMHIWVGYLLLHFPMGVGFGGMLPTIQRFLPAAMNTTQSMVPFPLNFEEVATYLYQPEMAGVKSFVGDFTAYFGIPFLILAGVFCYRLARQLYRKQEVALLACILFMAFQLCTSVDSLAYYNLYLPFGIAFYEYKRHANTASPA